MNKYFKDDITNATALTRNGRLKEATLKLQEALSQSAPYSAPYSTTGSDKPGYTSASEFTPANRQLNSAGASAKAEPAPDWQTNLQPGAEPIEHTDAQAGFSSGEFTHASINVPYQLYIPHKTSSAPVPLLVLLHGCTQDATDFAIGTAMNAVAEENGIAVLYPSQTARGNANKCWNWFEPAHQSRGSGEPAALSALTRQICSDNALDTNRVFVAGMSAGGAMAVVLGEQYPEIFAAVGVHSGLPTDVATNMMEALSAMKGSNNSVSTQQTATGLGAVHKLGRNSPQAPKMGRAQPFIVFHGAMDRTVVADNAQAIVKNCLHRASILDKNITSQSVQSVSAATSVTVTTYHDSEQRIVCEHWHLHSADHRWSGGNPAGSHTDARGPNASAEMVRFFLSAVTTEG